MTATLVSAAYGPAASRALFDAVVAAKGGDPLAPVTVVVPTNYVGVAARRLLAGGTLGRVTDRGDGVAGVTFLTAYRLAELLGAPRLAGMHRRPVSTPVLAAAVRSVLAEAPGMFAPVADHPATEEALVDAYRELSAVDDAPLDALARTGRRAGDVVRITRRARAVARARVVRRARPHGRRGRRDQRWAPAARRSRHGRAVPAAGALGTGGVVAERAGRARAGHGGRRAHRSITGRRAGPRRASGVSA